MFKLKTILILLSLFTTGIVGIFYVFGLTVNLTNSMPLGIYQFSHENNTIAKNDLVVFHIPLKSEQLLKKVVAVENDHITVTQDGVFLNGAFVANSKIFHFDSKGHPLTPKLLDKTLAKGEIFAMGEHIQSYDSRYFGTVYMQENNIRKVHLLFAWRD
jgi:signal peptidase I